MKSYIKWLELPILQLIWPNIYYEKYNESMSTTSTTIHIETIAIISLNISQMNIIELIIFS